ncbi:hypothetical protein [Stutzerimonas kunmingensis]|mgnify:CR=1 FL=1|jgi:hypothetical protein|uniref:hypothetical protein n=1 Tax=Stutzerimonas kunmingensis TaxID=1211807 RepID=UPI0030D79D64
MNHFAAIASIVNASAFDSALKKEIEFEQKLKALLEKYDMSLKDIIGIFEPDAGGNARKGAAPTAKISRRERIVKRGGCRS